MKTLSREIVFSWSKQGPAEHPSTLQGRVTLIRELAKYMINNGYQAFIMPDGMIPKRPRYLPYIYSNEELKRIFIQTRSMPL